MSVCLFVHLNKQQQHVMHTALFEKTTPAILRRRLLIFHHFHSKSFSLIQVTGLEVVEVERNRFG